MEQVKILGIAGSPRKGNTEYLVQRALEAAESIGGVVTEFVSLRGKLIKPCLADYSCFKKATEEVPCPSIKDDFGNEVMKKMLTADGILVGSPVYYGGPTAQIKALFDRSMALEALGMRLRSKVGGAITVSYDRNGGQEPTIFDMIRWMMIHDMIVVTVGPDRPGKGIGSYWGGICTQGFPFPKPSPTKEGLQASKEDEVGINSVIGVGKRVAEVAKLIKAGLNTVPEKELAWPRKLKIEMLDLYSKVKD
jgi:multimeric flavodoxin WrbA